jgi:small-conductance mechanosensitive channel
MLADATNITLAIVYIVGALVASWVIGLILRFLTRRVFRKTETHLDDAIIEAVSFPVRIAVIVFGFQLAIGQLEFVPDTLTEPINSAFFVIYLVLVYLALLRLIRGLTYWYAKEVASQTETELDDKFLSFFRALANVIVTAIVIIVLLGHFGIEPSALVATLGIGTLAVALAAQETLSDMIAGFMIMLDQPFVVGDRVAIQDIDTWGDVTEVGLRSTRILTRDNRMVSVPNSVIGKGLVVNYSDPSTVYRVETHVGIAYGTDVEQARKVMSDALAAEDWVMHEKPIEALLLEFGESALIFRVRCWIEHYVETRRVMDKMNSALYRALSGAEIVIPMPQRSVALHSFSAKSENELKTEE